jgi:peroxiredoxin
MADASFNMNKYLYLEHVPSPHPTCSAYHLPDLATYYKHPVLSVFPDIMKSVLTKSIKDFKF